MKYLIILCCFCWQTSIAQTFHFPQLIASTNAINPMVPKHWKVIDSVRGDLNGDQSEDFAVVLEYDQPVRERRAYGTSDTEIIEEIQRPRVLAIYFKQANHKFILATQNNNFILRSNEGGAFGDPYEGIEIKENLLNIHFRGGANFRWALTYQFKYERQRWLLVNVTKINYENTSGEMEMKNWDFLKLKLKLTKGNLQDDSNKKETISNLAPIPLRSFNTLKKPWTWEITKDEFL